MLQHGGKLFGATALDNEEVYSFVLCNENDVGLKAEILTYGATLQSLWVPDGRGNLVDVVLGCDTLEDYEKSECYLGCVIGRVANRIKRGRFDLLGNSYQLSINNGPNHLHGGLKGFNRKVWKVEKVTRNSITLSYYSPDGDEHYPGAVEAEATYSVNECKLLMELKAKALNQGTPVNLTNHSYFNLSGEQTENIYDHDLYVNADFYLPTDDFCLITGETKAVSVEDDDKSSTYDLRRPENLGTKLLARKNRDEYSGYDHYFCLSKELPLTTDGMKEVGKFSSPKSNICMTVLTSNPGVHFYTADYLDKHLGKRGKTYGKRAGFCLETQGYPDAVNHKHFPTIILQPGQSSHQVTMFSFSNDQVLK